jgi:O-succinylbenzoate synthase
MLIPLLPHFLNHSRHLKRMKFTEKMIILDHSLPIPSGEITERKILIIEYKNIQFELSPLPGFSIETYKQARTQLTPYLEKIQNIESFEHFDLRKPLFNLIDLKEELYSSVLFCLEQYLFKKLKIEFERVPLDYHELLINFSQKSTYCKIKIGKSSINEEVKKIREFIKLNPHTKLRLDGNQSFTQNELLPYLEFLPNIDYFEEPLKNLSEYKGECLPIALDENLPHILDLLEIPNLDIKGMVYKPSTMGGFSAAISLRLAPKLKGIPLIMSSCYEGKIGTDAIRQLAYYTDFIGPKSRHGLLDVE